MNNETFTLGFIRNYVLQYFPNTLWWDGFHKHEKFNPARSYKHRQGLPNEIRIEFDYEDLDKSWEAVNFTCLELQKLKYSFAVYYTEGGRSPHIHIYDLDSLEDLNCEQRTLYREEFLKKICVEYEPDLALCDEKHLCALEFANHFKYNKPKQLLNYFWNGINMGIDMELKLKILFGEIKKYKKEEKRREFKFGDLIYQKKRDLILRECSFEKVFDKYNIKYHGHMALCPFHIDTNYSLSFSNDNGLWKCFGSNCNYKGDIITLIKKLKETDNGNKK